MSTESAPPTTAVPTRITALPRLAAREAEGNKGSYGKVLVIAGSRGMAGAAVLAGSAALRGGAGLVRVAVPWGVLNQVAAANPCYLTVPVQEDADGRIGGAAIPLLIDLARESTVVAIGPGLGRSADLSDLVHQMLSRVDRPMVLDADGINAVSPADRTLPGRRDRPTVLTPHAGELARLLSTSSGEVGADRVGAARAAAGRTGAVVLLKGFPTVVAGPGGDTVVVPTGGPALATGGTGDVLTGVVAALLASGIDPLAAAGAGAWIHGTAGDEVAAARGVRGAAAGDLLEALPHVLRRLEAR